MNSPVSIVHVKLSNVPSLSQTKILAILYLSFSRQVYAENVSVTCLEWVMDHASFLDSTSGCFLKYMAVLLQCHIQSELQSMWSWGSCIVISCIFRRDSCSLQPLVTTGMSQFAVFKKTSGDRGISVSSQAMYERWIAASYTTRLNSFASTVLYQRETCK